MADANAVQPEPPTPLSGAHVLHVADSEVLARFGLMFTQLLPALAAAGLRTSLVTDDAEMIARLDGTPVERHRLDHVRGWRAWQLGSTLAARFTPPPTVVHLWGTGSLWWLRRWLGQGPTPTVIHVLGASHAMQLVRNGLRPHERVAVLTSELLTTLGQRFPGAASVCRAIPPAVALPFGPSQTPAAGRTLGVLCAAYLDRAGALDALVDAAAQLRRTAFDLQIAVIGVGAGAGAAWKRMRTREVHDCFSIINEPWLWEKVLPEIDVCVVPSRQQELWLTPLLAMALGKVVITSRDQTAEWFIENRTCWQFTPGSAVELAYLLERVLEQPKHAHELSSSAVEYVREHHTISELVEQLLRLYEEVIGAGTAAGGGHGGG